uniref:YafQ toxin protein n=1 Tax=Loigolactobacillus rennini TaxID=238013 RepID=A0A1K2I6T1_9LACO|nr:hypothetical protein LREN565_1201 [Loigolactobacillus rennini]
MNKKIKIITSNLFKKNLKRYKKKHYDISQLENVIDVLIKNDVQKLKQYGDHSLKGSYQGFRELHIQPNWLLVYRFEDNCLKLYLLNLGTHDDLFK